MAHFDILEAGFNYLEETINFGKRAIDDNTLYEINTLAVVRSSESVSDQDQPEIQLRLHNEMILFSINQLLRIMKDIEMSEELGNIQFDYYIDEFVINENYMLICTRDGTVTLIDWQTRSDLTVQLNDDSTICAPEHFQTIYSKKFDCEISEINRKFFIGSYISANSDTPTFYVVTRTGIVEKIHFELTNTEDATDKIKFTSELIYNFHENIHICEFGNTHLLLESDQNLFLLDLETKSFLSDSVIGIKNVHYDGQFYIVFDCDGNIYGINFRIQIFSLNSIYLGSEVITDFATITFCCYNGEKCIVGVKENCLIELISFPGFQRICSIPLTDGAVHLMSSTQANEEILFFTEIHNENENSKIHLHLQRIMEVDPTLKLKKLINKQLFDDAEIFAKNHNINYEIVNQARAESIVNKQLCNTNDINRLLEIMNRINDQLFKLELCSMVDCENIEDYRRILSYGAFTIVDDARHSKENAILSMKKILNKKAVRLDTFMAIYRTYNYQEWNEFLECNLIDELKKYLKNEQIEDATILYNRLDWETLQLLNDDTITDILYLAKEPLKSSTLFINSFIPITLKHQPQTFNIFVDWLYAKIYEFEKRYDYISPADLVIINNIIKLINLNLKTIQKPFDLNKMKKKLTNLIKSLTDIELLKTKYDIKLSLFEYDKQPMETAKKLLINNANNRNLEMILREFLCPYIIQNGLDLHGILLDELKELLIYDENYYEENINVLLNFVGNIEQKLEAIKKIFDVVPVPWKNSVRNLSNYALKHMADSSVAVEILEYLQNEKKFIILAKYNVNKHEYASEDKIFYYKQIFYNFHDPSVIDDIRELCETENDRNAVEWMMLIETAYRRNLNKAMLILTNNSIDRIRFLSLRFGHFLINNPSLLYRKYKNSDSFFEILNIIYNRLDLIGNDGKSNEIKRHYDMAKSIYLCNKHFEIELKAMDFYGKNRENMIGELIEKLHQDGNNVNFQCFIEKMKKISTISNESVDKLLLRYIEKFDIASSIQLDLAEYIYNTSKCPHTNAMFAAHLFKHLNQQEDLISGDETFLSTPTKCDNNNDNYLNEVTMARKLIINAIMTATNNDDNTIEEMPIMELYKWINICYLTNNNNSNSGNVYGIYMPQITANDAHSNMLTALNTVKSTFNLFSSIAANSKNPLLKYLKPTNTNYPDMNEQSDKLIDGIQQFKWNLNLLLKDNQHFTVYNLIRTFQYDLPDDLMIDKRKFEFLNKFVRKQWRDETMNLIVRHKFIDTNLLLNLLYSSYGKRFGEHLEKYLETFKDNPEKLEAIATVGLNLLRYFQIDAGQADLINITNLCKWWRKLNTTKLINYEHMFTKSNKKRLNKLIACDAINLNNLDMYCMDFKIDFQTGCLCYLKTLLLSWTPQIEYKIDISGRKTIIVKNNEEQLIDKCTEILNYMSNYNEINQLLETIKSKINFYYYEVFIAIITLQNDKMDINHTNFPLYRLLLLFLKNYSRISPPGRTEHEQWYGTFPSKAVIDPLSEFRLPFTNQFLSVDIWNIIKNEVNLETYQEWFKLSGVFPKYLNREKICKYAIVNALINTNDNYNKNNDWILYSVHQHLIDDVEKCAKYIVDLEQAITVIHELMYNMPNGVDKLNMAELCFKYAEEYSQRNTNSNLYTKVKRRYLFYKSMHILYQYGINDENYLTIVGDPEHLIQKLYNDNKIIQAFDDCHQQNCPNINQAVADLGTVFDLSIEQIRLELITSALKTNCVIDFETSDKNSINNFKKACYICTSTNSTVWVEYLLKIALNDSEVNTVYRANAFKCIYYTTEAETIETITEFSYSEFIIYMNKMILLTQLNELGIALDNINQLDLNSKKLLRKLGKIGNRLSIECVVTICKIYGFDNMKYWEFIIRSAIKLRMIKQLIEYVEHLKDRYVADFIKDAWNAILADGFSFKQHQNVENSAPSYIKTLHLLQTCPVLYGLNFENYIENSISNHRYDVAAILLQYLPDTEQEKYIMRILAETATTSHILLNDLEVLKVAGITGVHKVVNILSIN